MSPIRAFEELCARRLAGEHVPPTEWAALADELHMESEVADRLGNHGTARKLRDRAQVARDRSGIDERSEWEGRR